MKNIFVLLVMMLLAGCATNSKDSSAQFLSLSKPIGPMTTKSSTDSYPFYGFVADSQLHSRETKDEANWLRGKRQDRLIKVTLRPPALDWAARGLLRDYLDDLADRKVAAIFFLGDGANNGCSDEFIGGYGDDSQIAESDKGVLRVLHDFRSERRIPVFFILGNHDFLGAGSTSDVQHHSELCGIGGQKSSQKILSKFDVMTYTDRFNRESASGLYGGSWNYESSFSAKTEEYCGSNFGQQRRRGCYLAATLVPKNQGVEQVEFLLLDTADFTDVSRSGVGRFELEGSRGAMSFIDRDGIISQTSWFKENSSKNGGVKIALTHYPIAALPRVVPVIGKFSKKSQRFMDLFVSSDLESKQREGYVISAHTHTPSNIVGSATFSLKCRRFSCTGDAAEISELNIGSTTDFPTSATIARLASQGGLEFEEINLTRAECEEVNAAIVASGGWSKTGLDPLKPHKYREFTNDIQFRRDIYRYLDQMSEQVDDLPRCVGLWASELEGAKI